MKFDKVVYGSPNKLLGKYIKAYGDDLLTQRTSIRIPNGWTEIVIRMFRQMKTYHPGTKITSMRVAPASLYGSGIFSIIFASPGEDLIELPRSLKWMAKQARRKAFSTCAACGHRIGRLKANNLCSLCACKTGVRSFPD